MPVIEENSLRYLRFEPNPYRGDRYAIYERGNPDVLVFWTSSKKAALLHWDSIKDRPVRKRKVSSLFL